MISHKSIFSMDNNMIRNLLICIIMLIISITLTGNSNAFLLNVKSKEVISYDQLLARLQNKDKFILTFNSVSMCNSVCFDYLKELHDKVSSAFNIEIVVIEFEGMTGFNESIINSINRFNKLLFNVYENKNIQVYIVDLREKDARIFTEIKFENEPLVTYEIPISYLYKQNKIYSRYRGSNSINDTIRDVKFLNNQN